MKNFYTQYDCTKLNTNVKGKGPKINQYVTKTELILEIYKDWLNHINSSAGKRPGKKIEIKTISDHDGFKIIDYDYISEEGSWHYKYRFGLSKHIWALIESKVNLA